MELWFADFRQPLSAPAKGVTRVVFNRVEDIFQLLTAQLPALVMPKLPPLPGWESPPVFAPAPTPATKPLRGVTTAFPEQPQTRPVEGEGKGEGVALEPNSDAGTALPIPTVNMAQLEERRVSPQEVEAANKIFGAYKTWIKRRQIESAMPPREIACRTFYDACFKQWGKIKLAATDQTPRYQSVYLGVVPHLLVVIQ